MTSHRTTQPLLSSVYRPCLTRSGTAQSLILYYITDDEPSSSLPWWVCRHGHRSVPSEVRRGRVEEVVLDLGLKECAHTLVGNEHVRWGREGKRVRHVCGESGNEHVR